MSFGEVEKEKEDGLLRNIQALGTELINGLNIPLAVQS